MPILALVVEKIMFAKVNELLILDHFFNDVLIIS